MRNNYTYRQTVNRVSRAQSSSFCGMGRITMLGGLLCLALQQGADFTSGAALPPSNSVTLSWDRSPSPDVTGYRVYFGTASRNYSTQVDVGNLTTSSIPGLATGSTNYFAVTAYDANGLESEFSAEASVVVGIPGLLIHVADFGRVVLTINGPLGSTYDILATQSFTNWVVIGNVALGTNYSLAFTDANAASFTRRFYRTQRTPP